MDFQLTRSHLSQSRVIAKGRAIRDSDRLVTLYGGKARDWLKKSTAILLVDGRQAEIHWYECHGVGRVETKIKWIDEA